MSGVWLWQSYGNNAFYWLAKRLTKGTEELKAAGWDKIDWALASQQYRQELSRLYNTMHIFGMSQPVSLSDIFTEIYLLDKPNAWRRYAIEELQARSQDQHESMLREQRRDGVDLVLSQNRLYILGQPGTGKTTFLKYLVMQAVEGKLETIPIFVSLKAWSDVHTDLLPFLARQFAICNFPDAQPFIEQLLEDGKAIVLFDGLDEVNLEDGARARITNAIRDFARQYNKSRMVITCATAATDYILEEFNYCEVAEFTQEQIEAFVSRWFKNDKVKHEAFWTAFNRPEHERLRDLGRQPLLLTMLCLTFDETMAFPRRRAELYEEAIDALLKKWDTSRSIRRDTVYRKLSLGYKRQLLMEVAAKTFDHGELFMRKRDLVVHITTFLQRLPPVDNGEDIDGEAVLRSIEAQHGLLVERARDIYSFSHLTFHEYFTARYIADHSQSSVLHSLVSHASDATWREVLLLTASMLDYVNVARLFDCWCEHLQQDAVTSAELAVFIEWIEDRSVFDGHPRSIQIRIAVMRAALLHWVAIQAANVASALDLVRDRARTLALASTLASAHASTHILDLALALTLDLARGLVRDLDRERARTFTSVHKLVSLRTRALTRALTCALTLSQIHSIVEHVQTNVTIDIVSILSSETIQVEHISPALLSPLNEYLASTKCLLDCLEVAVVVEPDGVLNRLLCSAHKPDATDTA